MFREKCMFNCLKLYLYWLDILYNDNYILQVYIITFDTPNVECSFHDIEQFLPDQHKKEKKSRKQIIANIEELPYLLRFQLKYIGMKITTQQSKCHYFHDLTQ